MRTRLASLRESNAYQRSAWAWRWWGWVESHVGRLALLFGIGAAAVTGSQFVWGQFMSDWPGYALYLTTLASITAGAVLVVLAVIASRGQVAIQNTILSPPQSAPRDRIVIESDGILWAYRGGGSGGGRGFGYGLIALCPEHRLPLSVQGHGGDVSEIRDGTTVGDDFPRGHNALFCPEPAGEGHTMLFRYSKRVGEAKERALPLARRAFGEGYGEADPLHIDA